MKKLAACFLFLAMLSAGAVSVCTHTAMPQMEMAMASDVGLCHVAMPTSAGSHFVLFTQSVPGMAAKTILLLTAVFLAVLFVRFQTDGQSVEALSPFVVPFFLFVPPPLACAFRRGIIHPKRP